MAREAGTPVINISEKLSDANRARIVAAVSESMRSSDNDSGGYEAWQKIIGLDEKVALGQLTHPDRSRRISLLQLAVWYHPAVPKGIQGLDQESRKELMGMFKTSAEAVWGEEAGQVFSEGYTSDRTEFNPAELQHNVFAYAGAMIAALQAEKLLPEVVRDQAEEVIKYLPLLERVFANIRRTGLAEESFDVDNLGLLIQSMMPKIDIPGFDFSVQTFNQREGIGVSISFGRNIEKKAGAFKQATGETEFQGIRVGFTLGADNGRLKAIRVPNYDDSTVPGIVKNALIAAAVAAKFLGVQRDLSLEGIKQTLIGKLTNPQKSLEEIMADSFEKRELSFIGLTANKEGKNLVLSINGKVK